MVKLKEISPALNPAIHLGGNSIVSPASEDDESEWERVVVLGETRVIGGKTEGKDVSPGIRIQQGAPELHGLRSAPSGPNLALRSMPQCKVMVLHIYL